MKSIPEQLLFIRDGMYTQRFHTTRRVHPESVGKHSMGVVWLVWLLSGKQPSLNLVMSAAAHDMAEQRVGDMPSPAKKAMGQLFRDEFNHQEDLILTDYEMTWPLTDEEKLILKLADNLDGLFSCVEEYHMGNMLINVALTNFSQYTSDFLKRDDVYSTSFGKIGAEINNAILGGIGRGS